MSMQIYFFRTSLTFIWNAFFMWSAYVLNAGNENWFMPVHRFTIVMFIFVLRIEFYVIQMNNDVINTWKITKNAFTDERHVFVFVCVCL
jgi:hypothetical protein